MRKVAEAETDSSPVQVSGTVYVVDDDGGMRRLIALLARSVGLEVESYSSAAEFLESFRERDTLEQPSCLILDVRMPGMSGLQLQKQLSLSRTAPPIIFLSAFGEVPLATAAMRAGAVDFICKPFSSQSLLERIREAIDLDREILRKFVGARAVERSILLLTRREREVAQLLAGGQTAKQIAQDLSISSKTVDNHRAKIFEKMHVDNSTQLAQLLSLLK